MAISGRGAEALADQLAHAGGSRRRTVGRQCLVLFDGPATAVRAIQLCLDTEVEASVGVHVAELDRGAPILGGSGVTAALELAEAAPVGHIRVTAIVRDLLAGSGIAVTAVPGAGPDRDVGHAVTPGAP